MSAGEQVRHEAPKGINCYRLALSLSNGTLRFYPNDGVSFYLIVSEPPDLADGAYSGAYYDAGMQRVPTAKEVVIDLDNHKPPT